MLFRSPQGGDSAYALANPHNFQSMFKAGQLIRAILLNSASLLTSKQGQVTDPISAAHINRLQSNPSNEDDTWSLSEDKSTLLFKNLIYIPNHSDI